MECKDDTEISELVNITDMFIYAKILEARNVNPELKELTSYSEVLEFPNGGEYLIQLVHLKGEKLKIEHFEVEDTNE
jgi:hypothetical protein